MTTQILGGLLPVRGINLHLAAWAPIRGTVSWTAAHLFRAKLPLVYSGSGSGDKTFDWVLMFCALAAAAAGTAAWSALDRRPNYARAYRWFHLALRFVLASEMVLYGMVKVVPLQMPYPTLARLVEPFGNFSPMGVLWNSVGASPAYERFTGSAELLAGILLFVPRTALLGMLVALADATFIFILNMTYDVPVKVFSFHLIVTSLVLLGPDMSRLARFMFGEAVAGSRLPAWGRKAAAAQASYGLLLLAANGYGAWQGWRQFGGGAAHSPLYGIWNLDEPKDGWRRVIFDRPGAVALQKIDDSLMGYGAKVDTAAGTMELTKPADKNWKAEWRFHRSGPDALRIEGELDARPVAWNLRLVDRGKFMLVSRGFHWIQEYPFNR